MQIIKPKTNYPFIPNSKFFLIFSAVLVLVMFIIPIVYSPNWGTSFKGGTSFVVRFEKPVPSEAVRKAFHDIGFSDASVQTYGGDGNRYIVKTGQIISTDCTIVENARTKFKETLIAEGASNIKSVSFPTCDKIRDVFVIGLEGVTPPTSDELLACKDRGEICDVNTGVTVNQATRALKTLNFDATVTYTSKGGNNLFNVRPRQLQAKIARGLAKNFNGKDGVVFDERLGVAEVVSVGPDVGEKFRNDGIVSILFALGLILLYVAVRFDIRYAPGAVAALVHDVIITFGLLTLIQMDIALESVAALLAIVGYSLNDTIVTFDRIRENVSSGSDEPLPHLVNRSINECLSRTILTSVTTLLAIIFLALLGSGIVADFALTLIIGVTIGTYSSIFVASPIMLMMNRLLEGRKNTPSTSSGIGDAEPRPG